MPQCPMPVAWRWQIAIKTVFVGTRSNDRLYAIHQNKVHILAEGLNSPNGVAWRAPYLYLAEQNKITRYRFDEFSSQSPKLPESGIYHQPAQLSPSWLARD